MPQRLMPLIDSVSISQSASPCSPGTRIVNTTCGFCQRNSVTTPSISVIAVVSNHADTL